MSVYTHIQTGDWKAEKHVPAIEAPDTVAAGELFDVTVTLGKAANHPNTVEHHIRYIRLFFKPDDDKFLYNVGNCEFAAHGESAAGANEGPVHCHHGATFQMTVDKPGTLHAVSYCNIHGLWEAKRRIDLA